jgi:putative flippase GtrA
MPVLSPALRRFVRYSAVGFGTFLFDLCLLYLAVNVFHITYVIATPCAFIIAVSCNYALSRKLVFKHTKRGVSRGYAQFALGAGVGAAVTTLLVASLVSAVGMYFLYARVIAAILVGIANYLYNLYLNFKVVGIH